LLTADVRAASAAVLKTVALKDMAYNIGLTWKNVSSMTIKYFFSKCIAATFDSEHEEEF
jgi:hypothetical protein